MKNYAFGKNGLIVDVGGMVELRARHNLPPLLEISVQDLDITSSSQGLSIDVETNWRECVQFAYHSYGRFGFWGDIIAIEIDDEVSPSKFVVAWVASLTYPKAALAADLIPFILDSEGKLFWVGIKRGLPPGVGKKALIGGFRAIERRELPCGPTYVLESPIENLMHECGEEVGILLSNLRAPSQDTYVNYVLADASIPELGIDAVVDIHFLSSVPTDVTIERNPTTGELRVHETAGYTFVIRVDRPLTVEEIVGALHPTDETENASSMVVEIHTAKDFAQIETDFFSSHHKVLFKQASIWCMDAVIDT